jgi:predicted PurR-regulated permease PerM
MKPAFAEHQNSHAYGIHMINLSEFVRANKKVAIWAAFFALLFLVREVFGLVFLTFILAYIFNNAVVKLERHFRLKRYYWTVAVYLLFVSVVTSLMIMAMPRIITEAKDFFNKLPESMNAIRLYLDELAHKQPQMTPFLASVKEAITLKNLLGLSNEGLVGLVIGFFNRISHFLTYFLLATLFSFLIVLDLPNLKSRVLALRQSRFKEVYDETADSVAQFAMVVGYTFQAQILIAIINTLFTALGLWLLGIQPIALLSSIVFFAGLIPVWGTFISSVPILLLAFNDGGMALTGQTVIMIAFIHAVEAYILNPNIVSAVLKINPLLTLIILYLGHTLFGLWGVLLGVPVAVYVYRYIIMTPADNTPGMTEQVEKSNETDRA